MAKIQKIQYVAAFELAEQVYDKKVTATVARNRLAQDHGMNNSSAGDLIAIFRRMMQAKAFKRSLSEDALSYYLNQIKVRRGVAAAQNALTSARLHVAYYESRFNTKRLGFRKIIKSFQATLVTDASETLEALQNNLQTQVESARIDGQPARLQRLKSASKTAAVKFIQVKWFVRNPDVVAEVLHRAKGFCERCGSPAPFSKKSNGQPYLEVHHMRPLSEGGEDSVENSTALCPNCHRRAHFG